MTQKSEKNQGLKLALCIAVFVVIVFLLFSVALLAPAFVESTESNNNYMIKISGLKDLTADGETKIMIPLPVYTDGEPVFSDSYLKRVNDEPEVYRMDPFWNLSVEKTPYGEMMVLKTSQPDLSDINMILAEFDRKPKPRLLMPATDIPGGLTPEEFSAKESGVYESLVYINGTFDHADGPVVFDLRYTGGGGMKFCIKGDIWKSSLRTSVSSAKPGFSRSNANYIVTDSWH